MNRVIKFLEKQIIMDLKNQTQRQIKFRAYSHEAKKMMDWDLINRFNNLTKLLTLNHVDVMQFTGLKDKNGKEIYDGDILSDWTETDEGLMKSRLQVFWSEEHGQWRLDNSFNQDKHYSDPLWKMLHEYDYEVTGNIYETKDKI